jgi:hypothetical protein
MSAPTDTRSILTAVVSSPIIQRAMHSSEDLESIAIPKPKSNSSVAALMLAWASSQRTQWTILSSSSFMCFRASSGEKGDYHKAI